MELWIRSQDEQVLKLAEHFDIYTGGYDGREYYVIEESGTDVAQYKTKERALKVLDEIQDLLHPKYLAKAKSLLRPEDVKHGKKILEDINECGFVTSIPQFDVEPINTGIVVYNMPKE